MEVKDLLFTKTHEWIKVEGNIGIVGITDYAQQQLGEVVFIELPQVDKEVEQFSQVGTIESTKAASDLYTPVSGKILEVNKNLEDQPNLVNESCFQEGWIFKIGLKDSKELDNLLDYSQYQELIKEEEH
ncbi:MAG: glycine cleavage system protein H [Candidatus Omnitrophica bacterium 4484_70.2]|nr:MAG: glycine cleavage system protein H [Candidatus Omnitrophica bacterium 4484_70.2]